MKKIVLAALLSVVVGILHAQVKIDVKLSDSFKGPYAGQLFVYTLSDTAQQFTSRSMEAEPAFSKQVTNWTTSEVQGITSSSQYSLKPLDSLKQGFYKLVAILDTNSRERGNQAPGNLYSRNEAILKVDAEGNGETEILLNAEFRAPVFRETDYLKEVVFPSAQLSRFRKEQMYIKAGVVLPPGYYEDTTRSYPVVYIIPGWGGTHYHAANPAYQRLYGMGQGKKKIYVYLNPESQTPYGLHAFVDSRVNGPWGTALVEEFIPFIQQQFRASDSPGLTFLTGQSSGGYGALWLALHFPGSFGGCWVTSPDPLDFSSFTGVNLYEDDNYYVDKAGQERGIYLVDGHYKSTLRKSRIQEHFSGGGGQQQSFEAEFGLPDSHGRPVPLFDFQTGKIDKQVVAAWQPYDMASHLEKNWKMIERKMNGPVRVYVGELDNFLLHASSVAFGKKAEQLGAPFKVEVIPGADHFTTRSPELTQRIQTELDQLIR